MSTTRSITGCLVLMMDRGINVEAADGTDLGQLAEELCEGRGAPFARVTIELLDEDEAEGVTGSEAAAMGEVLARKAPDLQGWRARLLALGEKTLAEAETFPGSLDQAHVAPLLAILSALGALELLIHRKVGAEQHAAYERLRSQLAAWCQEAYVARDERRYVALSKLKAELVKLAPAASPT
jgi:hypothetical protein